MVSVADAVSWFISDISVIRSCWSICSLCSTSNNANLLLCYYTPLFIAVYLERLFCFIYRTQLYLQHGGVCLVR